MLWNNMITSNVTGDILNWNRVSFKVGHIIKSILLSPLYITASLVASCTKAGEPQSGAGFLHKLGHHYTFPINKMIYGVFHYFCYLFLMDFHVVSYLFLRNFCGWIPGVFPCHSNSTDKNSTLAVRQIFGFTKAQT